MTPADNLPEERLDELKRIAEAAASDDAVVGDLIRLASWADAVLALLSEREALVGALANTLALAELKWGNLDPDANKVFADARALLPTQRQT